MGGKRYSSLDGLRAFAAVCIVMMHVLSNMKVSLSIADIDTIIGSFTNFTFLFMIVSSFGMCCGYYENFKNSQINLADFYKKRYIRIFPFFSFLVLIDLVVNFSCDSLYEGFADLTLAFGLLPNAGISVIGVGWFLGLIFVFYMIFPFFVFLMDNKRRALFVFVVAILLHFLSVSYFSRSELMVVPVGRWNIVYSFPYFVIGALIYLYRETIVLQLNRIKSLPLLLLIVTIVGYYLIPNILLFSDLLVFSMFVVYAITRGNERGFFNNSVMNYIGNLSMEIYLCHMVFFRCVEKLHLELFISNNDILYVVTFILVFMGALFFSLIWKKKIEPRIFRFLERI